MQTARWVYDLPGGFCRFLRSGKFSSLFSLRKAVLRAKPVPLNALLAERESTTTVPKRKGVRRWKPIPATMANGAGLTPFYSFVGKVDSGDEPTESISYFRQIGADVKSFAV